MKHKTSSLLFGAVAALLFAAAPMAGAQVAQHLTTLGSFQPDVFGGDEPFDALIQGSDGYFYGTASGFLENDGGVFKADLEGNIFGLAEFSGSNGSDPQASLVQADDGNFYGTTQNGGTYGNGTIFQMTPGGKLTSLYSFSAVDTNHYNADGAEPMGALIQASDGKLYGTTSLGGANGGGTVFRVTLGGAIKILHAFTALNADHANADGFSPRAALLQASDGNFYGTAYRGGVFAYGTLFQMSPDGTIPSAYSFGGSGDGAYPATTLIQPPDGSLYGTTSAGGTGTGYAGNGTIFQVPPGGQLTTVHAFGTDLDDGSNPSSLVVASDGSLAGTTTDSGAVDNGTVFRYFPDGTMFSLDLPGGSAATTPFGGLLLGSDGNLYGTSVYGGTGAEGTIFRFEIGPAITSAATAVATAGQPFGYQITARSAPTGYTAAGLPPGLSINAATGLISGTPMQAGTYGVALGAANAAGTGGLTLTLTVAPPLPVVTVSTVTPTVTAGSGEVGVIMVSLSSAQPTRIVVNYVLKGSAGNGTDYVMLSGTKRINAGKSSKKILIIPTASLGGAARKTVKLVLKAGTGYTVGAPAVAKIKLLAP